MKPKKVLLLVDNCYRDGLSILLIAEQLREVGVVPILCNKVDIRMKFYIHQPDLVVLSTAATHRDCDREKYLQLKKTAKIAIIPQEGGTPDKNQVISRRYGPMKVRDLIDRVFLWGPAAQEWLLEEGLFKPEQLTVTGTARLDVHRCSTAAGTQDRSCIGIVTKHRMLSSYLNHSFVNIIHRLVATPPPVNSLYDKDRNIEDTIWYYVALLRSQLQLVHHGITDHGLNFSWRPSPFESAADYEFLTSEYNNIEVNKTDPVHSFVAKCHTVVVGMSTVGIEAMMNGIPAITTYRLLGERFHDHIRMPWWTPPHLKFYWQPETFDELIDMCVAASENRLDISPNYDEFSQYLKRFYNYPCTEPASKTIAREIKQLVEEETTSPARISFAGLFPETTGLKKPIYQTLPRVRWTLGTAKDFLRDLLGGKLKETFNYNYYPWHLSKRKEAKRIYRNLPS